MRRLKVQVERVVRPIRAAVRRKDKMREELLAHLTACYGEELANGRSEETALRNALERFGDPAALRAELQSSVPAYERALYVHLGWPFTERFAAFQRRMAPRGGESFLHYAMRKAVVMALALLALDVFVMGPLLGIRMLRGDPTVPSADYLAHMFMGFHGAIIICCIPYIFCAHALERALRAARSRFGRAVRVAGWSVLSCAVTLAGGLWVRFWVGRNLDCSHPALLSLFIAFVALTPAVLAFLGVAVAKESKRREEWECLPLDEESPAFPTHSL